MSKVEQELPNKELLLGNEAIAAGCLEAGVRFAAAYPGTPSSEILQTIIANSSKYGVVTEWSNNEMVAFEKAMGYSLCGMRAMVSMKHAGLNWVADPLSVAIMGGVRAGVVIITADDPHCHSSANEQDNRFYGLFFETLVLEPASPAEAKEMAKKAFAISEEIELPVILRTVTRVSHARSGVEISIPDDIAVHKGEFVPDKDRFWISGAKSLVRHRLLHQQHKLLEAASENSEFNQYEPTNSAVCVIAAGVAWQYANDVLDSLGLKNKASTLKLGVVNPLPNSLIRRALAEHKQVIILEEGEPFVELLIRSFSSGMEEHAVIKGRHDGAIPYCGELTFEVVQSALRNVFGLQSALDSDIHDQWLADKKDLMEIAPKRGMFFCAGCPHNSVAYALSELTRRMKPSPPVAGDIGCYVLMAMPPYKLGDVKYSMGASISVASGISAATGQKAVAVIGDGTFFHSGIPGLINAVYNGGDIVVIIVDNGITGMTGRQPNPGTGSRSDGQASPKINIEEIVSAIHPASLEVVDAYDTAAVKKALVQAFATPGVAVVIARQMCAMEAARRKQREGKKVVRYQIDPEKCIQCMLCVTRFNCIALSKLADGMSIDDTCVGCGVCAQICPNKAIMPISDGGV